MAGRHVVHDRVDVHPDSRFVASLDHVLQLIPRPRARLVDLVTHDLIPLPPGELQVREQGCMIDDNVLDDGWRDLDPTVSRRTQVFFALLCKVIESPLKHLHDRCSVTDHVWIVEGAP